jgi:HEPN domain-containing protein
MGEFVCDPNSWLYKFSPTEWIRAGLSELSRAEEALANHNVRALSAGCKRAAGMALNAVLIFEPNDAWGRTYVEHLTAIARNPSALSKLREACTILLETSAPSGVSTSSIVTLRTPASNLRVVEAAKDVIAHAFAVVKRHEGVLEPSS